MAPTLDSLTIADDPDDWRDAGFLVDDDDRCRIGLVRIELTAPAAARGDDGGRPRTGIVGWTVRDLASATAAGDAGGTLAAENTIDGIPTTRSTRPPDDPADHPNGAVRIDHLVLTSDDGQRTQAAFEEAGWDLRRVRDVPGSTPPRQQRFFRAGEVILELVAPTEPAPDERARSTRLFGLALVAADLDATVAFYRGACNPAKEAVQPGRRIATLRTRDLGISVPIAFMTP